MTCAVSEETFRAAYERFPNDVALSAALRMSRLTAWARRKRYGLPAKTQRGGGSHAWKPIVSRPAIAAAVLLTMPCVDKVSALQHLAEQYQEQPIGAGITASGNLAVVTVNPDTGSWSALTISPAGLACVTATGRAWVTAEPGPPA